MIRESHDLLIELWSRVKSHVPAKERLEVADIFIAVFDEFGQIEDDFLDEALDKELRAAARSHFGDELEPDEEYYEDDSDY